DLRVWPHPRYSRRRIPECRLVQTPASAWLRIRETPARTSRCPSVPPWRRPGRPPGREPVQTYRYGPDVAGSADVRQSAVPTAWCDTCGAVCPLRYPVADPHPVRARHSGWTNNRVRIPVQVVFAAYKRLSFKSSLLSTVSTG